MFYRFLEICFKFHIFAEKEKPWATINHVKLCTGRQQENSRWHDFTFFSLKFLQAMYWRVRKNFCQKKVKSCLMFPGVSWYIVQWKILQKKVLFLLVVKWYLFAVENLRKKVHFWFEVIRYIVQRKILRKKYYFCCSLVMKDCKNSTEKSTFLISFSTELP